MSDGETITYDLSTISALEPRTIQALKDVRLVNILTDNELRSKVGREPLIGGADDLYKNAGQVPIATDKFTQDNRKKPSRKMYELMEKKRAFKKGCR